MVVNPSWVVHMDPLNTGYVYFLRALISPLAFSKMCNKQIIEIIFIFRFKM